MLLRRKIASLRQSRKGLQAFGPRMVHRGLWIDAVQADRSRITPGNQSR
jgi:hypothetical protein